MNMNMNLDDAYIYTGGISIDIDSLIFGERYGSDTLVCIRHAGLYGKRLQDIGRRRIAQAARFFMIWIMSLGIILYYLLQA